MYWSQIFGTWSETSSIFLCCVCAQWRLWRDCAGSPESSLFTFVINTFFTGPAQFSLFFVNSVGQGTDKRLFGPRQANLVLIAYASSESRGAFRQKARSLAPLNGWACAVTICHDGMLEDTNSLDGAHLWYSGDIALCVIWSKMW